MPQHENAAGTGIARANERVVLLYKGRVLYEIWESSQNIRKNALNKLFGDEQQREI